jgi:RNA recognition motif-containing protein
MESKLYVGNLAYTTSEADLQALFAQAGTVKSVAIIKDRESGRSKGFGFVEMSNQAEAEKAISMFNGQQFQERALTVNIARPREERGGFGGDRGGYGDRRGSGKSDRNRRGGGNDRRSY